MRNWRERWLAKSSTSRWSVARRKVASMFLSTSSIARTGECENCHIASASERVVKACSPPESDLTLVVACALLSCDEVATRGTSCSLSWSKRSSPPSPL